MFLQRISFLSEACHFEFRGDDMATYLIPTPEQMNCSGDLPTNWKMFREAYEDYLVATGLDKKNKKIQVATLKTLMGTECKKILKRLQFTEAEMEDPGNPGRSSRPFCTC